MEAKALSDTKKLVITALFIALSLYEAKTLAALNDMAFIPCKTETDDRKSAGPATCLLVLSSDQTVKQVLDCYPVGAVIGEIQ